jgi:chorismate mutase
VQIPIRAIRGAIQIDADIPTLIFDGTHQLIVAMMEWNRLNMEDVVSVLFTMTPDLRSSFPAMAARAVGMLDVPLMCAQEIDVPGALPRVIRLLAHVESSLPRSSIRHPYLRGGAALRPDLVIAAAKSLVKDG